jgi:D-alanyl-D-alanine carboxypeptidase/D-alanyl-D-alanine endopeptidase (penicillin-binding protein 7)
MLRAVVVATSVLFAAAAWADAVPGTVAAVESAPVAPVAPQPAQPVQPAPTPQPALPAQPAVPAQPVQAAMQLASAHAIVVDDSTGQVLLEKDGDTAAPIASMTKLMTAMVVLDAGQDMDERLRVTPDDLDHLKHTYSGVAPGALVSRGDLLKLALTASDNHAAHALARNYPGGMPAFLEAVQKKIQTLGLQQTVIGEPTGLSPDNRSSAQDMVNIVRAAGGYAQITEITSRAANTVVVSNRRWTVRNTNHFVGSPGWNILLSKTGFTNEAGLCLSMRLEEAGRTVAVVLMGAVNASARALDVTNIRRWLAGEPPVTMAEVSASPRARHGVAARHHHPVHHHARHLAGHSAPAADA